MSETTTPPAPESQALTAAEVELVKSTFAKVVPISEVAAQLFYDRLFEQNPDVRALFTNDIKRQGRLLMQMLAAAVAALDKVEALVPTLQALAIRHTRYGVQTAHYDAVGAALLWTLGQGLGDAYTPEANTAWAKTYGLIANVMIEATQPLAA